MSPLKFKIAIAVLAVAGCIIKMLPDPQISAPVASAPPVKTVTTVSSPAERRSTPETVAFLCSQLNVSQVPDIQWVPDQNGQPILNDDGQLRAKTVMVSCPPPPTSAATAKPASTRAKVASR